ncbi:hypothetical protein FDUTEX481_00540 [Tolypothrix sp. PCC 7601]|nr:hypothetical protein FDUTEX481_00540 [Tolypothrix sp. PCC 7601]
MKKYKVSSIATVHRHQQNMLSVKGFTVFSLLLHIESNYFQNFKIFIKIQQRWQWQNNVVVC